MQFILNPLIKYGLFLFYLLLIIVALVFTFRQKVYHKSVLAKTSTNISGIIDSRISKATNFIHLAQDNQSLQNENANLRKQLEMMKVQISESDSTIRTIHNPLHLQTYSFIPAEVINNSINKDHNMITINKGKKHGVNIGMGVISSNGVIGYVTYASDNFARVLSTLNKSTKINARIKGNDYFGTLVWEGEDARYANLTEIPKYIKVEKGDTIETDGKSPAIPGGIMIGTVINSQIDQSTGELDIKVKLKENFTRLRYAQVVINLKKDEIIKVEQDSIKPNAQL